MGTLDALMSLSDDLAKLDQYTDLVMVKLYNYMANCLEENDLQKLPEYTKANNKVNQGTPVKAQQCISRNRDRFIARFCCFIARFI